jgi:hypothetical protein
MFKFKTAILATLTLAMGLSSAAQASSKNHDKAFFDLGYERQTLTLDKEEFILGVAKISVGYQIARNLAISVSAGTQVNENMEGRYTDTYIDILEDGGYSEQKTTQYDSTFELSSQYSIEIETTYPLRKNLSFFGKVGYMQSEYKGTYYDASLVDNKPSATPQADFDNDIDGCLITGIEGTHCSNPIIPRSGALSLSGATAEVGFNWRISTGSALLIGYKKYVNLDEGELDSVYVNFRLYF